MTTHEALRILDLTVPTDRDILTPAYQIEAQVWPPERLEENETPQAALPRPQSSSSSSQLPPAMLLSPQKKKPGTLTLKAWSVAAVGRVVLCALYAIVFSSSTPAAAAASPTPLAEGKEPSLAEVRARAEQGEVEAQYYLGACYSEGQGVALDDAAAAQWFMKAAAQGHAAAQFCLATAYMAGMGMAKDPAEALQWYHKSAAQGHAPAERALGHAYRTGTGVAKDEVAASAWYLKAAQHGDARAQHIIAGRYASGDGLPKDPAQSLAWYRRAAEQGHAGSQNNMGALLYTGQGADLDQTEGMKWFILSAGQGDKDAIEWAALASKALTPQQVAEAEQRAAEFRNSHPAESSKKSTSRAAEFVPGAPP